MKNYAMPLAIALVGLGLMSIGFNLNGNQANATPAAPVAFNAGPDEPTIVWYDSYRSQSSAGYWGMGILRAWSDGTIEFRSTEYDADSTNRPCSGVSLDKTCDTGWFVISSPNEGLNAAADINFDSRVNAEDLGIMLAAWGEAPRNDYPPSDCPLGLIP